MTVPVYEFGSFPAARTAARPLDPPEEYRRLLADRRLPRVRLPVGREVFLAGHHEDVRTVLSGPVSADGRTPGFPMARGGTAPSSNALSFFRMDGAEHRRYRKLATSAFTVAQATTLRPLIRTIIEDLIGGLARQRGPVDLVTALALPVPVRVICLILGVPVEDQAYLHRLSTTLTRGPELGGRGFVDAVGNLHAYIGRLASAKRAEPSDDLITALAHSFDADPEFDPRQLVAIVLLLLVAGHEMIASTIALGALAVLTDPDMREALRTEPELIPNAVEELLRYTSVTQWVPRAVVEDFEVGGQLLRAGDGVLMLPLMANRDPEVFDDPDQLDARRENADRHIAFGFGPHHCLGLQLARAELHLVLETLFDRLPRLRLAVAPDRLTFRQQSAVYGVESLPVIA